MNQNTNNQSNSAMWLIGILFFIFGFVTWLNGPLITFVKYAFHLDTDAKAFWVTTAFYMAYFFLALPSASILRLTGMKKGMAIGLIVMAIGTFLFGSYATARNYTWSLIGLFVIGAGLSVLQTASNPYISILGPIETASRRISIMGIANKIAGILSPIILSVVAFKGIENLDERMANANPNEQELILTEFASQVYIPYMVMAIILIALAIWVWFSSLPEIKSDTVNKSEESAKDKKLKDFPHLWLGACALFLYVGVEVIAGDAIGIYGQGFGIPAGQTTYFTSFTLGGMLIGYLIGIATIPKYMSQEQSLKYSAYLGIIFTILAFLTKGYVSIVFVALLGLANALMWPAIFPMAIRGLGKWTELGSAILIMGIAGGAILPKIFAYGKEYFDFQWVFLFVMIPSYIYILYYATKGYKK